jgi:hypothetical protein
LLKGSHEKDVSSLAFLCGRSFDNSRLIASSACARICARTGPVVLTTLPSAKDGRSVPSEAQSAVKPFRDGHTNAMAHENAKDTDNFLVT